MKRLCSIKRVSYHAVKEAIHKYWMCMNLKGKHTPTPEKKKKKQVCPCMAVFIDKQLIYHDHGKLLHMGNKQHIKRCETDTNTIFSNT